MHRHLRNMLICGAVDACLVLGVLFLLVVAVNIGSVSAAVASIAGSPSWLTALAFVSALVFCAGALDARVQGLGRTSAIGSVVRGVSAGLAFVVFMNCLLLVTKAAYAVEGGEWPYSVDASGALYLDWFALGKGLALEAALASAVGALSGLLLARLNRWLLRLLPS